MALVAFGFHGLADDLQPGPAVSIGQGCSGGHFCNVGSGMKLVAFDEGTVQCRSQAFAHAGFAATRHPHDNDRALEHCLDSASPFGSCHNFYTGAMGMGEAEFPPDQHFDFRI